MAFTWRTRPVSLLLSFSQPESNAFPKNSQTQHNLLFCASEDLWGYEVYTDKQLQHTWKCLCWAWNLIRKPGEIHRGNGTHILLFQCANHPNLRMQYNLTCKHQLCSAIYDVLAYFSRSTVLDLMHAGLDRTSPGSFSCHPLEKSSMTAKGTAAMEKLIKQVIMLFTMWQHNSCPKSNTSRLLLDSTQPFTGFYRVSCNPLNSCMWEFNPKGLSILDYQ